MHIPESKTAIPMRKARATLAKLTDQGNPVLLLNFNTPAAILVPLPHNQWLAPAKRASARARLRTQFEVLLRQALPKGP